MLNKLIAKVFYNKKGKVSIVKFLIVLPLTMFVLAVFVGVVKNVGYNVLTGHDSPEQIEYQAKKAQEAKDKKAAEKAEKVEAAQIKADAEQAAKDKSDAKKAKAEADKKAKADKEAADKKAADEKAKADAEAKAKKEADDKAKKDAEAEGQQQLKTFLDHVAEVQQDFDMNAESLEAPYDELVREGYRLPDDIRHQSFVKLLLGDLEDQSVEYTERTDAKIVYVLGVLQDDMTK